MLKLTVNGNSSATNSLKARSELSSSSHRVVIALAAIVLFIAITAAPTLHGAKSQFALAGGGPVVVVSPSSLQGWQLTASDGDIELPPPGAQFEIGPASPPLGVGSLGLRISSSGSDDAQARNPDYAGVLLSSIAQLSYSTYVDQNNGGNPGNGGQSPYIILQVDYDNNGTSDDLLLFEPVYQEAMFFPGNPQGPLALDTWQTWDALAGGWYSINGTAGSGPGANVKPFSTFFTPAMGGDAEATIVNSPNGLGGLRFVTGFGGPSDWGNFIGNIDNVMIGFSCLNGEFMIQSEACEQVTYDFEPDFGPCAVVPADLVSWWPGEGDASDIQDGNDGSSVGNTAFVPGFVDQAFSFDGTGDAVSVGSPTNLQLQDFTIDAWLRRTDTTLASNDVGGGVIFSYGQGGYGLGIFDDGSLFLSEIGISNVNTTGAVAITDVSWHHVAVTKSGSTVIFYVDGVAYPAAPYNPTFVFSTNAAMGARGDTFANSLIGELDEVEIFSRALTLEEIQSLYIAGPSGKCQGCESDTVPPVITCPSGVAAATVANCPPATSTVVNFSDPDASDNCPGVTVECSPPSGSTFPTGTTTVTCMATDSSDNIAQCTFTVTVFNGCLQDEANPGSVVLFNTFTGDYRFCCNAVVIKEGKGTVSQRACNYTITHNTTDRRVSIQVSFTTKDGKASIQAPVGQIKCTITDKNITNNTCQCPLLNNS